MLIAPLRRNWRVRKDWWPRFRGREEVPVRTLMLAEADGRYYGSGRVVFDIFTACTTLVVPFKLVNGKPLHILPAVSRRADIMALRKIENGVQQRSAGSPTVADASEYPLILEYLATDVYPDGAPRQTSALVIVSDGALWRVCLSDKDNSRVLWKTGASLGEALVAIELALCEDNPSEWRRSAEPSNKSRKRI